jgi:hypothetical protein
MTAQQSDSVVLVNALTGTAAELELALEAVEPIFVTLPRAFMARLEQGVWRIWIIELAFRLIA